MNKMYKSSLKVFLWLITINIKTRFKAKVFSLKRFWTLNMDFVAFFPWGIGLICSIWVGKGVSSLALYKISLYILNLSPLLCLKPFEKFLVVVRWVMVVVKNDFSGQPKPRINIFSPRAFVLIALPFPLKQKWFHKYFLIFPKCQK